MHQHTTSIFTWSQLNKEKKNFYKKANLSEKHRETRKWNDKEEKENVRELILTFIGPVYNMLCAYRSILGGNNFKYISFFFFLKICVSLLVLFLFFFSFFLCSAIVTTFTVFSTVLFCSYRSVCCSRLSVSLILDSIVAILVIHLDNKFSKWWRERHCQSIFYGNIYGLCVFVTSVSCIARNYMAKCDVRDRNCLSYIIWHIET